MYVPMFGSWTKTLFLIGVWAVLFKTLYVATAAHSRMTADFLSLGSFVDYRDAAAARSAGSELLCVFFPLARSRLYLVFGEPRGMVIFGGFFQGITLPVIAAIAVFFRYRRMRPAARAVALLRRVPLGRTVSITRRRGLRDLGPADQPDPPRADARRRFVTATRNGDIQTRKETRKGDIRPGPFCASRQQPAASQDVPGPHGTSCALRKLPAPSENFLRPHGTSCALRNVPAPSENSCALRKLPAPSENFLRPQKTSCASENFLALRKLPAPSRMFLRLTNVPAPSPNFPHA